MGLLFSKIENDENKVFEVPPDGRHYETLQDIQIVCDQITEKQEQLAEAVLSYNTYSELATDRVSEVISNCKELRSLSCEKIYEGACEGELIQSLDPLMRACLNLPNLQRLNLGNNTLTEGAVDILAFFLQNAACLKDLELDHNLLGPQGANRLADVMREAPDLKLQVFSIRANDIQDIGMVELALVFTHMKSLRKLCVANNSIAHQGFVMLGKCLETNLKLQVIDFSDNFLNDKNCINSVRHSIQKLSYITIIDLSDCLLGDFGVRTIVGALACSNAFLRELNIAYNEFEDIEAGETIVELVHRKELLEVLDIRGNNIHPRCVSDIQRCNSSKENRITFLFKEPHPEDSLTTEHSEAALDLNPKIE